ncbi:hypothetical protein [Gemmobacter sp.]|uniref:phage tail tip fiber protein n=1 Tax=Gemmobacter sp. TaxID=1898957 RepID=UPI002AFF81FD|nr:hypothetical protein [Gemmobacter sp.]
MPPVFGFVAGAITGWTTGAIAGAGIAGAYAAGMTFGATMLTGIVGKLLTTVAMSALQTALQKRSQQGGGLTISTTLRGEQNPETIILGRYATSGQAICPPMSHGKNNGLLTHVVELCSAPGATMERVIIGDEYAELSTTPHPDGYGYPVVTPAKWANHIHVKYCDGRQTAADPMLLAQYGSHPDRPWTPDMVGAGICYAILTFTFNAKAGLTQVPRYRFEMGGIPLYDIRKDSTAGGTGSQRLNDPSTWTSSTNPVVQAWNVFHGIALPGGDIWGGQVAVEDLPTAVWTAAMNACDAPETLSEGGSEPRYRAGIEAALTQEPAVVLTELLKACAGQVADLGGTWKIRVGGPALPAYTHSDDDVLVSRQQELDPFPSLSETWNAVAAQYPDPEAIWETRDAPVRTNATWEAADRFGRRTADLTLPAVPYKMQVQRLMRAWIEDERRFARHIINLPPDASILEPLDTTAWSSQRNGYAGKSFEVAEVVEDVRRCVVQISEREVDPSDYSWSPSFELPSVPVATGTTPVAPAAVSGFAAAPLILTDADGRNRRPALLLSWDSDLQAYGIAWEIRLAATGAVVLRGGAQDVAAGSVPVADGILPATAYQVRASLILDRPAAWTGWIGVVSPDVRLGADDLVAELADRLEVLNDWIDGGVSDLPSDLAALASELADEAAARADAMTALAGELSGVAAGLAAEAATRAGEIAAHAGQLVTLAQGLADEATARTAGMADLASTIAAEQADRTADVTARAVEGRRTIDRVHALTAEVLELAAADHAAREAIRQTLTVTLEGMRASYDQQIVALAGADGAAVQRITTLEAASTGLSSAITQVEQAMVEGDDALALLITSMAAGTVTQFDAAAIWYFDTAADGWTGATWTSGGYLAPTGNMISPAGLAIPSGIYAQVRLRVQKSATLSWSGWLWWAEAGQDWDSGRRIAVPEPVWSGDEGLITLVPMWTGSIDRIRLDLPTTNLLLDWVAVGRPAPGASSAELAQLRQTVIAADQALAEDITQLQAELAEAEGGLAGVASAVGGLDARVTDTEAGLVATSGALTALEAQVNHPASGLAAVASAIDALETVVEAGDGQLGVQSLAVRTLRSALTALEAEAVEGLARNLLADRGIREVVAEASQRLDTRIDLSDGALAVVAEEVTVLKAAVPGLASVGALSALTSRVSTSETTIIAQGSQITQLTADLAGLDGEATATATALSALDSRVTSAEGAITSQSGSITSLSNSLTTTNGNVATAQSAAQAAADLAGGKGKVIVQNAAPAVADRLPQNLWIDTTGGANTPKRWTGSAWVAVTDKVATDAAAAAATALDQVATKADASALAALDSRVTSAEGTITATGSAVTTLQGQITNPTTGLAALATAIDALETLVEAGDGRLGVQSLAVRTLRSALTAIEAEAIEGLARNLLADRGIREVAAEASQALNTRVDLTDAGLAVLADEVTVLKASVPGLASAGALSALSSRVSTSETTITAHSSQITQLTADLAGLDGEAAATASALSALDGRVTTAEGTISSQSSSITSLSNTIGDPVSGLIATRATADGKGKVIYSATAPAVADRLAQNLWVDTTGGANTPKRWNGTAWVAVTDKVATDAAAAAADALAQVATRASASAVAALDSRVTSAEGTISSQSSSITSLSNGLTTTNGNVATAQSAAQAAADLAGTKGKVIVQNAAPAVADRLAQNLWIDTTGGANTPKRWNGSAWAAVSDKVATDAAAAAADALAQVATKASASALAALDSRVTSAEGTISSQSSSITSLSNGLTTTNGNVATAQSAAQAAADLAGTKGKVIVQNAAPAVADRLAQNLWIDTTGGANTPKRWNGSAWAAVSDKVATDAAAAAADALAQVATKASASALAALDSRVTSAEGTISSQSSSITSLSNGLTTTNGNVATAQSAAQAAADLAGSKGKVIVQNAAPAIADRLAQNLWIDTTGGTNTPKRWNGSAWAAVTDKVATDAAAAAASALAQVATRASASALAALDSRVTSAEGTISSQSGSITSLSNTIGDPVNGLTATRATADGKGKVIYGATAPAVADRLAQNLWVDTTGGANTPKRWNGTAWAAVTDKVATDAAAAAADALAQVATKASASALSALDSRVTSAEGTISSQSSSITSLSNTIGDPVTGLAATRATADGKGKVFYQSWEPWGAANQLAQNLWIDTTGGANTPKRWNGTAWAAVTDKVATDAAAAAANALAQVATKASASALSNLTSIVSDQGDQLSAQAEALTDLGVSVGRFEAGALFRATVEATPAGALSRIGLKASASAGEGAARSAAMFLEATSDGKSRALFQASTFAIAQGAAPVFPFIVDEGVVYIDTARIREGSITSAKIGNVIQSNGYVAGPGGAGWAIYKGGFAEFNNITIRRQIEVASGEVSVPGFAVPSGSGPDTESNDGWARPGKVVWVRTTPVEIDAWHGARRTYIATAQHVSGGVSHPVGAVPDVFWGWDAQVLPLTRWEGGTLGQTLRLRLEFWSRNVTSVANCTVTWKIYEVS